MTRTVEGTHAGLPRKVMGNRERRTTDGKWATLASGELLRANDMQIEATYFGHSQVTVEQWVYLYPIFKVCAWKQGL